MRKVLRIFAASCLALGWMSAAAFAQNAQTVSLEGLEPPTGFAAVTNGPTEQVMVNPEDKTIMVVQLEDMTSKKWQEILADNGRAEAYLKATLLKPDSELLRHSVEKIGKTAFVDAYFKRTNGATNRLVVAYVDGHVCAITIQTEVVKDLDKTGTLVRQVFDQMHIL